MNATNANVSWSEKAREQIKDHDLSCLSKEKKGAAVEKKDEDQALRLSEPAAKI